MVEAARLIDMLKASASQKANVTQPFDGNHSSHASTYKPATVNPTSVHPRPVSCSLLEALTHAVSHGIPAPSPDPPLSAEVQAGLDRVLKLVNAKVPHDFPYSLSGADVKTTVSAFTNDRAISNCKRVLAVPSNESDLSLVANNPSLSSSPPTFTMAGRLPVLGTSDLPAASPQEQIATASPARGHAMLNSIFKSVRVPEFRFKWLFWAEKGQQNAPKDKTVQDEGYASRPKPLGDQIVSVKEFYQHFNNIPVESLKLRDSIHLFHLGIKPVWEDPRNVRGGAWYFKIGKDVAGQFWHEMCLLAVGDVLQGAVETKRPCKSTPCHLLVNGRTRLTRKQPSTTIFAVSHTPCDGTLCKLRYGIGTRRMRQGRRSCWLRY